MVKIILVLTVLLYERETAHGGVKVRQNSECPSQWVPAFNLAGLTSYICCGFALVDSPSKYFCGFS
jgi:hypothetical protein